MEQRRLNEFICNFLVNAGQMAYVEDAHGTLMLLENFNEIFRYFTGNIQTVTLFYELEILNKYITVQKMQHGDRFNVYLINEGQNKGIFINHLSVIDFFDSILHKTLEQYEKPVNITLEFETGIDNRLKIVLEVEGHKEIFTKVL